VALDLTLWTVDDRVDGLTAERDELGAIIGQRRGEG
jgi:hypothetical protein